jgi:hypothetical protein
MNTTLIEGKSRAEYDAMVLEAISLIPNASHHPAAKQLLIGVRNEHGDVYRVIKVWGMQEFSDFIATFRMVGLKDEFAEAYGDKGGYDAVISGPARS